MRGFTLVELLVVIAIAGILSAGGIASISSIRSENSLLSSADLIKTTIEKSRMSSLAKEDGYGYSIKIVEDGMVWFPGSIYDPASALNKKIGLPSGSKVTSINIGGGDTVLFNTLTGTTTPGTIIVSSTINPARTRTIVISGSGKIYNASDTVPASGSGGGGGGGGNSGVSDSRHVHYGLDWSIQGSSELKFVFITDPPQTNEFFMHPHFNGDESVFSYVGNIIVQGANQEIRINTHYLDGSTTNLSIRRESDAELKPVEVYIDNKLIATYLADGSVVAGPFGGIMDGQ
jgi:prepilin-type N-terminal cleavage/methylation domain-containing protein